VLALAQGHQSMDLMEALSTLANRTSAGTTCPCTVNSEGEPRLIDAHLGANVVAICREAIGNSQRYSQATALFLTVRYRPEEIEVRIADDGRGFEVSDATETGFGLAGMHARAHRLGGKLAIETAPGCGTSISLRAPAPANLRVASASQ